MTNFTPLIIGGLLIAAMWGAYLFPSLTGSRPGRPIATTHNFDRFTHVMAEVQRKNYDAGGAQRRDAVRIRRKRVLVTLISIALFLLVVSFAKGSMGWFMAHLVVDVLIGWYMAMLTQIKQRRESVTAEAHFVDRPHDADQPQFRIVAGG